MHPSKKIWLFVSAYFIQAQYITTSYAEEISEISAPAVDVEETKEATFPGTDFNLNGRELSIRREATLGETLNDVPGVTSSYFGPNASRPILRGMEGERAQIMQNGTSVLDASSASPDHAIGVDPMVAEQIEIVRGPASLIYGGGNVGGVINVTDHRIPKESLDGMIGRGEAKYGGADNERSGVAVVDVGNGRFAIHADAYQRLTDDLKIPKSAAQNLINDGYAQHTNNGRLLNSGAETNGGALGASLTFEEGYAGISFAQANNFYGTVAEPNVKIDMRNDRWDFASEIFNPNVMITRAKFLLTHTEYQHQEIDGGIVGTTFSNRGNEGRIEATHTKLGDLSGSIGAQFSDTQSQAIGEEAFMPSTQTKKQGIYLYEEMPMGKVLLSGAARLDYSQISSAGGDRFGPSAHVSFAPTNIAVGGQYAMDSAWSINLNFSHAERAPAATELFAHGAHIATNQYMLGNSQLSNEISNNFEVRLNWKTAKHSASFSTYYNRFSNFITGFNTGCWVNELGNNSNCAYSQNNYTLSETQIKGVPAEFKGVEAQGKFRIYEGQGDLDLNLRGDYLQANDRETGKPLPRIAPMRIGAGFDYQLDRLHGNLDVLHAFKQDRLAAQETSTGAYTLVNATLSYQFKSAFHLEAFAKARNLLNEDIRDHSSYLKEIAPMGGRSLLLGIRGEF